MLSDAVLQDIRLLCQLTLVFCSSCLSYTGLISTWMNSSNIQTNLFIHKPALENYFSGGWIDKKNTAPVSCIIQQCLLHHHGIMCCHRWSGTWKAPTIAGPTRPPLPPPTAPAPGRAACAGISCTHPCLLQCFMRVWCVVNGGFYSC